MELGVIMVVVGSTAFITGWAWGLWIAYRESVAMGVASTLVPLFMIYVLFNSPRRGWIPLVLFLGGLVAFLWGYKHW